MKQKNIKIITCAIVALVIIIGIVVVGIWGFKKELRFEQSQSIDVYVEQSIDETKIKEIVHDTLGTNSMIQAVEIYKDGKVYSMGFEKGVIKEKLNVVRFVVS